MAILPANSPPGRKEESLTETEITDEYTEQRQDRLLRRSLGTAGDNAGVCLRSRTHRVQGGGTLDRHGYVGTLFQRRKQCLNNARRKVEAIIRDLEVAFDETFDKIAGCQGDAVDRVDFLQAMANDVVELLLIYFARTDGDMVKKQNMKKALLNFKAVKNIDLDAIMEYYKIKL